MKTWIALVLAACGVSALLAWRLMPAPVQPIEPAQPLPSLIDLADTVPDTGPVPIRSVPKSPKAAELTKLPEAIIQSDEAHILAVSKLDAEERDYTLSAVLDRPSGITTIHATPEPLPWLAVQSRGSVGLYTGLRDNDHIIRLAGQYDVLRVKRLHAGVTGSIDSDGQWFVGVGAEMRF